MERTLRVLSEMLRDRVIEGYALTGAVAALFYAEPVVTHDLDVLIVLPATHGPLVSLAPVYDYLRARGYAEDAEHVQVEGIPVQFLPAYDGLTEEALTQAAELPFGAEQVRVVRVEHLIAIALQTGRAKDHARIALLLEESAVDEEGLSAILERHGLGPKWQAYQRRFGPA